MRYVMSDVHGEYELFTALLREIGFSDDDELFIIGDVIDKGDSSVRLLKYVLFKDNIHLSMGNHEYEFLKFYYSQIQKDDVDFDAVNDLCLFVNRKGFEFVEHGFGPCVEFQVILRRHKIKDFELDSSSAAAVQFLFLGRVDYPDEEVPVRIFRNLVDENMAIGP